MIYDGNVSLLRPLAKIKRLDTTLIIYSCSLCNVEIIKSFGKHRAETIIIHGRHMEITSRIPSDPLNKSTEAI